MWARCTLSTRYRRFHSPVHRMPAAYLSHVLACAGDSLVAAGAGGTVRALATLRRTDPTSADLGVLVEDDWQRRGLGSAMVARLVTEACADGLRIVTADVLREQAWVVGLLRRLAGPLSTHGDGPALRVRVDLCPLER